MEVILQVTPNEPRKIRGFEVSGHFSYYRVVLATFLPLTHAEIDGLLAMMSQLYAQDAIPWDEGRARRAILDLLGAPDSGGTWLMVVDGVAVGYFVLTICFSLEFFGRYALLDEFFVEEAWRGQGIGGQALNFVEEQCRLRGVMALRLEVDRNNDRALDLYRRRGFEAHDRYMMTRWLPHSLLQY
jgi:GNAT superfamily N-acetyltransferase